MTSDDNDVEEAALVGQVADLLEGIDNGVAGGLYKEPTLQQRAKAVCELLVALYPEVDRDEVTALVEEIEKIKAEVNAKGGDQSKSDDTSKPETPVQDEPKLMTAVRPPGPRESYVTNEVSPWLNALSGVLQRANVPFVFAADLRTNRSDEQELPAIMSVSHLPDDAGRTLKILSEVVGNNVELLHYAKDERVILALKRPPDGSFGGKAS